MFINITYNSILLSTPKYNTSHARSQRSFTAEDVEGAEVCFDELLEKEQKSGFGVRWKTAPLV
jgi:hypothetical protein